MRKYILRPVRRATRALASTSEAYRELVAADELRYDEAQAALVEQLTKAQRRLDANPWAALPPRTAASSSASGASPASGADGADDADGADPPELVVAETHGTGIRKRGAAEAAPAASVEKPAARIPRGVYIWGDVGTGKSRCMDLFFECAGVEKKRRVHFHRFMLTVHERIRAHKVDLEAAVGDSGSERDALVAVGHAIADECNLLCFDEFQVQDIADAMIMQKLFTILWSRGTVVVATSNRPPSDLYLDGLHRQYFVPFIDTLEQFCRVHHLPIATDYRLEGVDAGAHPDAMHVAPLGTDDAAVRAIFETLDVQGSRSSLCSSSDSSSDTAAATAVTVRTRTGRAVPVHRARGDACWFTFNELCAQDTGAADFQAICAQFRTVVLSEVPYLSAADHNEARRFITLVDELYEHGVRLVLSAEAPFATLFKADASIIAPLATDAVAASQTQQHTHANTINNELASMAPPAPMANLDEDEEMPEGDPAAETTGVSLAELSSVQELEFAFRRSASRISEMTSERWWKKHDRMN